jgi:hypothetical protein
MTNGEPGLKIRSSPDATAARQAQARHDTKRRHQATGGAIRANHASDRNEGYKHANLCK